MSALFPEDETQEVGNNYGNDPLYAYKSTSDPDTLYHHQAMKAEDRTEFLLAMIKEVTDKINNGNLSMIRRYEIPGGITLLPGVCKKKINRYIKTLQIKKCIVRLNVDGSRIKKGVHYAKLYSQVSGWSSIRILLILVELEVCKTTQVDYVQAFPQEPI